MRIGTDTIRALFPREKPPVPDCEWDETTYVEQRLCAYRDALAALARVRALPPADDRAAIVRGDGIPSSYRLSCARTGDLVLVDIDDPDPATRSALRSQVECTLQRVFSDAHAWRRSLLPAYFERHRSWRAVTGAPIQH